MEPATPQHRDLGALSTRADTLDTLRRRADDHERNRLSARTRRLYTADWGDFISWCDLTGLLPLPAEAETVRLYLTDLSLRVQQDGSPVYQPTTLERRLAAINWAHEEAGLPGPARGARVRAVLTGIARERQHRPRRMRPLLLDDVRQILRRMDYSTWPAGVAAARDAFVLLAGFAGALRRSELAELSARTVTWSPYDGLHVLLPHSKTDQEGEGAVVPLPFGEHPGSCVVCAYVRWVTLVTAHDQGDRPAAMRTVLTTPQWPQWDHLCRDGIPDLPPDAPLLRRVYGGGAVHAGFLSGDALHAMVQRRAAAAGYRRGVGFHSLRAGFVTQARRSGCDARAIRRQTRHGSDAMVDVYDREYNPLQGNAVAQLGL